MDPFFRFGSRCRSNFCLPEQKKMFSSFSFFFSPNVDLFPPRFTFHVNNCRESDVFFFLVGSYGERLRAKEVDAIIVSAPPMRTRLPLLN
jgi:hypothetical protein